MEMRRPHDHMVGHFEQAAFGAAIFNFAVRSRDPKFGRDRHSRCSESQSVDPRSGHTVIAVNIFRMSAAISSRMFRQGTPKPMREVKSRWYWRGPIGYRAGVRHRFNPTLPWDASCARPSASAEAGGR